MSNPRKPRALKIVAGTDQPCRRAPDAVELPLVDRVPAPPDWLPNAHAAREWLRLAEILHANRLLTEASLTTLAHLCAMHGRIVQKYTAGEMPNAALSSVYRALANDFGLSPVAQGKISSNVGGRPRGNRFANHIRRDHKQDDFSFDEQ
jgi:phage terminase small subunit